jgi:hypothetical protein
VSAAKPCLHRPYLVPMGKGYMLLRSADMYRYSYFVTTGASHWTIFSNESARFLHVGQRNSRLV